MMSLNSVSPRFIAFTGSNPRSEKRRENVEDAAKATGAAGAGAAATRGASFKMFKSSQKLNQVVNGAAEAANVINQPIKQSNSLWNAFKLNYRNFKLDIAKWAESSKMPGFMKSIFKGSLGKFIGGGAAVFVFITGVGEIIDTTANQVNKKATRPLSQEYNYSRVA